MEAQARFEFCREAVRAKKPERLYFALMPQESDAVLLAAFAERFLAEQELTASRIKPGRLHIALFRLGPPKRSVLYAAKLAGQAVAAAGLKFAFDSLGSLAGDLALLSRDPALVAVQKKLGAALAQHRLKCEAFAPHITLASGIRRQPLQAIVPFTLTVTGLALLRSDGADAKSGFDVLRRWPLNKAKA